MRKFVEWLHKRDPHMATRIIRIVLPIGMIKHAGDDEEAPDEPVTDEPCGCDHKKKVLLKDKAEQDDDGGEHPLKKIAKLMGLMGK